MKTVNITFIIGILAGIGTWFVCMTDAEITQYILALVSLIAFWASDNAAKKIEDID